MFKPAVFNKGKRITEALDDMTMAAMLSLKVALQGRGCTRKDGKVKKLERSPCYVWRKITTRPSMKITQLNG
jgi:hypothetical protein